MIFSGKGRIHLNGQKNLTDNSKPLVFNEFEYVYLPLLNMNSTSFEILVKAGDHVKVGQMVAFRNDHFYVPIFASVSGEVVSIDKMMSSNLIFAQHIKIKNDNKFERCDTPLAMDVNKVSKEEIVEAIKQAGITGCGGSGFPTYIKYGGNAKIDTLLINGVECEPFITIDYHNMKMYKEDLIMGIKFLLKASGANKCIIAFKKGKDSLVEALSPLVEKEDNIEIKLVPDVYPMGWERTLVKEVFKKQFNKLPSEVGIIVNNSTTVIKVGQALTSGLSYTTGCTISGDAINQPTNVVVPTGTMVSDIISLIGGYKKEVVDNNTKLIMGGPMMGKALVNDGICLNSYNNAITFLFNEELKELPCLRCSRCVDYCPSGLQPVAIKNAEIAQDVDLLKKLSADTCVSCGLCSYICPSRIQVTDYTAKGKARVDKAK
ncbi:MAG: RnfABCDGE type electron transport complex subunit C [Bacilli bacterium]|jgi:electron transport complex protein RnfC|nr:RnfABCDGE type electron transport complex subunit C [Bacilli bacterium]